MTRLAPNASRTVPLLSDAMLLPGTPRLTLRTHGRDARRAGRVEPRAPVLRRRRARRADRPARRRRHDQRARGHERAGHLGVRGADRRRPGGGAGHAGRPAAAPLPRRRRRRAAVRMLELDRVHLRPGVQRRRQPHAVVHRPPAVRHRATARHSAAAGPATGRPTSSYCATFARRAGRGCRPEATVLVQDYHLVARPADAARSAPRPAHLALHPHPVGGARTTSACCPTPWRSSAARACSAPTCWAFTADAWADAFLGCCEAVLGASVAGRRGDLRRPGDDRSAVHPLGVDGRSCVAGPRRADVASRMELLRRAGRRAAAPAAHRPHRAVEEHRARPRGVPRDAARRTPRCSGEVVHLAFAYPSRHDLPEYREYTAAVQRIASDISEEFGRPGWEPVRLEVSDDFPRSLAAYALADVLVVNPVRDGMNLVAKEGPVLSPARPCAGALARSRAPSPSSGADAFVVNPYDVIADQRGDVGRAGHGSRRSGRCGVSGWRKRRSRCRRRGGSRRARRALTH